MLCFYWHFYVLLNWNFRLNYVIKSHILRRKTIGWVSQNLLNLQAPILFWDDWYVICMEFIFILCRKPHINVLLDAKYYDEYIQGLHFVCFKIGLKTRQEKPNVCWNFIFILFYDPDGKTNLSSCTRLMYFQLLILTYWHLFLK